MPRVATAQKRRDPKARHIDGGSPWNKLKNRDPRFHYVWAYELDPDCGVAYYESLGYTRVTLEKDGPAPSGGSTCKPGEVIRMRDNVLMCIKIEDRERIEREGPDGNSGSLLIDEIEDRILDKRGTDLLRGIRGNAKVFGIVNETGAEEALVQ